MNCFVCLFFLGGGRNKNNNKENKTSKIGFDTMKISWNKTCTQFVIHTKLLQIEDK